jgi:PPOX class probable F420-dependent enzyme
MSMSKSEREDFLAQVHVGILAIAGDEGAGPLAVPIWYSYQPGGALSLTTGPGTRKARAIAAAGRFSLCVQDDQPPYQYVTVEGAAVIEPASRADRLSIAQRYLGPEQGAAYVGADEGGGTDSVVIRMTPEHWLSRGK